MIILGTPQVSFDFGIPDWLLVLILLGIYLIYRLVRMLHRRYLIRKNQDEFNEIDTGLDDDQSNIDEPSI